MEEPPGDVLLDLTPEGAPVPGRIEAAGRASVMGSDRSGRSRCRRSCARDLGDVLSERPRGGSCIAYEHAPALGAGATATAQRARQWAAGSHKLRGDAHQNPAGDPRPGWALPTRDDHSPVIATAPFRKGQERWAANAAPRLSELAAPSDSRPIPDPYQPPALTAGAD